MPGSAIEGLAETNADHLRDQCHSQSRGKIRQHARHNPTIESPRQEDVYLATFRTDPFGLVDETAL